jgi:hypothetical protein
MELLFEFEAGLDRLAPLRDSRFELAGERELWRLTGAKALPKAR